eukprot:4524845-Pleurochrysis_carterae.AAC.1
MHCCAAKADRTSIQNMSVDMTSWKVRNVCDGAKKGSSNGSSAHKNWTSCAAVETAPSECKTGQKWVWTPSSIVPGHATARRVDGADRTCVWRTGKVLM